MIILEKEKSYIGDLSSYLKKLLKEEQLKPKVNRKKIRGQKSVELRREKTIQEISEPKSCVFGKINRLDKPLARQTKKKEKRHKLRTTEIKERTSLCSLQTSEEE